MATVPKKHPRTAFTLIEIMVVVAIIGLIAAMGLPSILSAFRKEGLPKALDDVKHVCNEARQQAIFTGKTTEVVFHPIEKKLEVAGATADPAATTAVTGKANAAPASASPLSSITSATLPDDVSIAMLDVNLREYSASDEARVRFFPNGTCDEMTLILNSGTQWRKITLEISTSLTSVSTVTR